MYDKQNKRLVKHLGDGAVRRVDRIREIHALNAAAKSARKTDRAFAKSAFEKKAAKLDLAYFDGIVRFGGVVLEASETDRWYLPLRALSPRLKHEFINRLAALNRLIGSQSEPQAQCQPETLDEAPPEAAAGGLDADPADIARYEDDGNGGAIGSAIFNHEPSRHSPEAEDGR